MFDNEKKSIHDISLYYKLTEDKNQFQILKCNYIKSKFYEQFLERLAKEVLQNELFERKMFNKGIMGIRLKRDGDTHTIEIIIA